MYSIGVSMKLTVVVFSGLLFHVACHDSRRLCFDVESKTICYFMPIVSSVDWDTAWKTCKELDATLPVILNKEGQEALVKYLSEHSPVQTVWTAGRYFRNSEWKWLNNQTIRPADVPNCRQQGNRNDKSNCINQTQAVLTKKLEYEAIFPKNGYYYICSFPDSKCTTESPKSITWKGGCLSWTTNHRLRLNKARNECLKGGGDLVTFSEDGDLQNLQNLSSVMQDADENGYLIGLHWNWWIWNTTGAPVKDIKFNLLEDYGDVGGDCLLILVTGERSTWSRDRCSENKTFICQTETRRISSADAHSTAFTGIVIGVVVGSVLLLFVLTSVIIILGRNIRNTRTKADVQADIDKTYEDLHNPGIMADVPIAGVDNGFYTDLVPTQQGRNVHHHDEPLYEDL